MTAPTATTAPAAPAATCLPWCVEHDHYEGGPGCHGARTGRVAVVRVARSGGLSGGLRAARATKRESAARLLALGRPPP